MNVVGMLILRKDGKKVLEINPSNCIHHFLPTIDCTPTVDGPLKVWNAVLDFLTLLHFRSAALKHVEASMGSAALTQRHV